MTLPIALQLYTVRDQLNEDFDGTLEAVAKIGFKHVEFAGLADKTAEHARAKCDALGLSICSMHAALDPLLNDFDSIAKTAGIFGCKHIVCSFLAQEHRTPAGYRAVTKQFDTIGQAAQQAGLQFCYHNHSFEFDKLDDGSFGMEIIFDNTDPKLVGSELDVYWVQHGHHVPTDWMTRLTGRAPLLHIKDMKNDDTRGFTEVGTGTVDIPSVVKAAPAIGAEYLIIEQDSNWAGSPLESAKISFNNLQKIVG